MDAIEFVLYLLKEVKRQTDNGLKDLEKFSAKTLEMPQWRIYNGLKALQCDGYISGIVFYRDNISSKSNPKITKLGEDCLADTKKLYPVIEKVIAEDSDNGWSAKYSYPAYIFYR